MATRNDSHRVLHYSRGYLERALSKVAAQAEAECVSLVENPTEADAATLAKVQADAAELLTATEQYRRFLTELWVATGPIALPTLAARSLAEATRAAKIAAKHGAPHQALWNTKTAFGVLVKVVKLPADLTAQFAALPGKPGHKPRKKPTPWGHDDIIIAPAPDPIDKSETK